MTQVYGVIGSPIAHSLSPVMHSAALSALGLDARYVAFDVPCRLLRVVLKALAACGIDGLNVTIPLKEAIVRYLDELQGDAAPLRAVNTVVVENGRLIGYNTDVAGFAQALEELGWQPRPCSALVLGAGGGAKAVAWVLTRQPGSRLTIASRHPARARQLARGLLRQRRRCVVQARPLRGLTTEGYDVIVNATPVGMRPGERRLVEFGRCRRSLLVYDLVYTRRTRLVAEAARCGCRAANGLSMLVGQGAEAFRLWHRREPPVAAMRRAVEQALH